MFDNNDENLKKKLFLVLKTFIFAFTFILDDNVCLFVFFIKIFLSIFSYLILNSEFIKIEISRKSR